MKYNAEKASVLIAQALRLCQDFNLAKAKAYLSAALNEIQHVTKKRDRRENLRLEAERNQLAKKKAENDKYKHSHNHELNKPFPTLNPLPPEN